MYAFFLLFSYSCGYKNLYDRYSFIINQKYPEILVRGGNYEPPGFNMHLAKAVVIFDSFIRSLMYNVFI